MVIPELMEEVLEVSGRFVPLVMVLLSVTAAVLIFPLREQSVRLRSTINIGLAVIKVVLVALLVPPVVVEGVRPEFSTPFLPGLDLVLRVDPLALFFAGLSVLLWLLTTIYAVGYLEGKTHRSRFFGFFSLCVTATVGLSFSGNLITFLLFYELLTLVTYPLVAHWGNPASVRAARLYLRYALTGGLSVLVGVVWLTMHAGPVDFTEGGAEGVVELARQEPMQATVIFVMLVGGLAVKTAIFPLHGWLPAAMVAPAPVSALLHAVAVVKAGAFGIVRVIDDVYGVEAADSLGVLSPLLVMACVTVLFGSYVALRQQDLKRRLAYSTVSQVSYIVIGITLVDVIATAGGLAHLVHQGIMKITLFFCAGLFAEVLHFHRVSEMRGLGRRMPWTSAAFTVGAFGMIGLPPTAGFVSKWQLGQGALASEHPWVLLVLLASTLLNAAYFLPVVYTMWFHAPELDDEDGADGADAADGAESAGDEADDEAEVAVREPKVLLIPTAVTALLVVGVGLIASLPLSPWETARIIAEGVFG
ncbi:MAG: proton-conducting transporter membrane subunit [Nesterenkonia sp.]|nr:proton-conducting transporter membrane subunit [Nesterenkonia sp.]